MNAKIAYLNGAEPFFAPGGSLGCLCLHGFGASPAEVRWLAQHLASNGHTVYAPRLAGHGTQPADLARTRWRDWYASALDGVALLRGACQRVAVIGHSMGGLLALLLASEGAVEGAAALASPIQFSRRQVAQVRSLSYVRSYIDVTDRSPLPQAIRTEQQRRGEPALGRVRYDHWPLAAVLQLFELARTVDRHLHEVAAPLLLLYSYKDSTAGVQHGEYIVERVNSVCITFEKLQESGHILPQDCERERVFALTAAFVDTLASAASARAVV
ncbi:MAG: alpha/beta fold hydrolase [Aggregatilineales bacterium]